MPSLDITADWRGLPLPPDQHVRASVRAAPDCVRVDVDAPWHGDPPPPGPPGPRDGLWAFEVVEAFIASSPDRYLEIEIGPHGHWLALAFEGVRQPVACPRLEVAPVRRDGMRWRCTVSLPAALLPGPIERAIACAIHGRGEQRVYASTVPLPGPVPDFHQPLAWPRFNT